MSNLKTDIEQIVEADFLSSGEEFTAFEITQAAKLARHRYVKPYVHAMFEEGRMPGYDRRISEDIPGNPYVYFPAEAEDEEEETISLPTTIAKVNEDGTVLRLRKCVVAFLGLNTGDVVEFGHDPMGDTLYVSDDLDAALGKDVAATAKVGSKLDVRIKLDKLGLTAEPEEVVTFTLHVNNGARYLVATTD